MPMAPIEEHVTRLGALYHGGLQAVEDADAAKASQLLAAFIETLRRDVGDAVVKEMFLAQEALRLVHAAEGTKYSLTSRDLESSAEVLNGWASLNDTNTIHFIISIIIRLKSSMS